MTDRKAEPVAHTSPDIAAEQIERLRDLFPEVVTEGKVDFDRLRGVLGETVDTKQERYSFSWNGKRDALQMIRTPSNAALVPAPEESIDFDTTANVFIEGENLEVLKLLYKSYFGRVKMIYIDPPYNTGNDFIYPDDFTDPLQRYLKLTGQKNGNGDLLTSNPETNGRDHSAWLSMMYPRLFLARQLLREDGFIVISIDDTELHSLRMIVNETFGEENYIATLVWDRNRKNDPKFFSVGHEYMVVYARNKQLLRDSNVILRLPKEGIEDVRSEFLRLRNRHGDDWEKVAHALKAYFQDMEPDDPRRQLGRFTKVDEYGPYRTDGNISWPGGGGPRYDVPHPITKKPCKVPKRGWVFPTRERMDEEIALGNVVFGPD